MPEYVAPGVFIEEIPAGPKPIEGVSTSTAAFVGITEQGPMNQPTFITNLGEFARIFGGHIKESYLAYAVQGFFQNGGKRCYVVRIADPDAAKAASETFANASLLVSALNEGSWGNHLEVSIEVEGGAPSSKFNLVVRDADSQKELETFGRLSVDKQEKRYFANAQVVNGVSQLIVIGAANTSPESVSNEKKGLAGGANGIDSIAASHFEGTTTQEGLRTGLVSLEAVDDVNILCVPDVMIPNADGTGPRFQDSDVKSIQGKILEQCSRLKDRFAILDPLKGKTVDDVHTWRMDNLESKYAALYYPWIRVSDTIQADNETTRLIPPSGHIAGIYARTDVTRGVHKAPANEVIRGAVDLERVITHGEQEKLNPDGINCIRQFPGRGTRVWGARTVSGDPEWKYVNVRRLFLYLEESIEKAVDWVVFEPNAEPLWKRVTRSVTAFLNSAWRGGMLMGRTPDEAFFVKCDRTTMTQQDIDNGRLICVIGVAPVKPAEFVIFRIHQWQGGSAVTE